MVNTYLRHKIMPLVWPLRREQEKLLTYWLISHICHSEKSIFYFTFLSRISSMAAISLKEINQVEPHQTHVKVNLYYSESSLYVFVFSSVCFPYLLFPIQSAKQRIVEAPPRGWGLGAPIQPLTR